MEKEVFEKFEQVHDRYDMWLDAMRTILQNPKYSDEDRLNFKMKALGGMLNDAELGLADLSIPTIPKEIPILVGHTTKPWGVKDYQTCEPGTPVYEFQGAFQIELLPIDESKLIKIVRFTKNRHVEKDRFENNIKFLNK